MRGVVSSLVAGVLLAVMGCGAERVETAAPALEGEALFRDVLEQHRELNRRVDAVGHRLLTSNADVCAGAAGEVERTAGFSVHTETDYPEELRPLARHLLGVGRGISVRSTVEGGPADAAGVREGDRVARVGGMPVAESVVVDRVWAMAERRELQRERVKLGLRRDDSRVSVDVATVAACAYPVTVVYSGAPNAYTDGEGLFITSELVRETESDSRLALILAHELAHALLHDLDRPSPELELEADRAGLALLARAGFDMEDAIAEMDRFGRTLVGGARGTHPDHEARVAALREVADEIAARQAAGDDVWTF